jgi:DNA-binding Xre family transcriptional regulator
LRDDAFPDLRSGANRIYIPVTMGRHKTSEAVERRRLGAEIARRMAARGMKPADLATAAGLDDSQMSKVLGGRAGLSLYSLRRVADALGCTRAELLAAADAPLEEGRRPVRARPAARAVRADPHPQD